MDVGQFLRSLRDDARGASVIELALVGPLLAYLFMGVVDASNGVARKHQLEQSAQRAVEMATSYGTAGSDFSRIDDEAASAAGVPVSQVTFDQWLECDGVRQQTFYDVCDPDEPFARYVSVEVTDDFVPTFPYGPIGSLAGVNDEGVVPITVDAQVRIQ